MTTLSGTTLSKKKESSLGTNYYLVRQSNSFCPECKHDPDEVILHIGKSSMGWCFHLHVIPELNLNSLKDWQREFAQSRQFIRNEYHEVLSVEDMLDIITKRRGREGKEPWSEEMYRQNYAEPGPNNLVRSKVDGRHCVGHGEGTWDLIAGNFS